MFHLLKHHVQTIMNLCIQDNHNKKRKQRKHTKKKPYIVGNEIQHEKGVSQNKNRKETIHQNWNQVLFDTCKRRGIDRIGNHFVDSPEDLAKVIFKWENNFFKKFKNKLLDL